MSRTRATIDLYLALGVAPNASAADIKRAFRRKAREYHPDVSNLVDAEERFKQIQAAYEVLKDGATRAAYDRTRPAGVGDVAPAPPVAPRPPPAGTPQKLDVHVKVEISYAESIAGVTRSIPYKRRVTCRGCQGVRDPEKTCRTCWNLGWVEDKHHYEWTLRPGTVTGASTCVRGLGDRLGGRIGDLHLSVTLLKQSGLTRKGVDFHATRRVRSAVLEDGGEIQIDGPSGRISVRIAPNTRSGTTLRVAGVGLPHADGRGALYLTLWETYGSEAA